MGIARLMNILQIRIGARVYLLGQSAHYKFFVFLKLLSALAKFMHRHVSDVTLHVYRSQHSALYTVCSFHLDSFYNSLPCMVFRGIIFKDMC